ncbi:MAG TPA: hypothetical protein VGR73_01505 [Bryobacteraceae bacterium]|nr:hypothetical protein [Bryobacteraceae bacterium]
MPSYRIHRLKDHLRHPFRIAPHVGGTASVKPRDYEPGDTVDASGPYAAYFALKESAAPLQVGDVLESEDGSLKICKYVGFEEARWVVPEAKLESDSDSTPPPAGIGVPVP